MKVSVVVIVKNGEDTIGSCLDSLMRQTHPAEVVVVDGNSTDRTPEIVSRYPVRMVTAPKNDNYGISRNIGVTKSSGNVTLFMDADDFCFPTWCENVVSVFLEDPSVGIVTVPAKATKISGWFLKMLNTRWSKEALDFKNREISWREVNTRGSGFSKEAIMKAGGFDEDMFFGGEDKDMAIRIARAGYKIIQISNETIRVTPVKGIRNYLQDKFVRIGVGHGYFRKKHGKYRPPISASISIISLSAAALLLTVRPLLSLPLVLLAIFSSKSLLREILGTYRAGMKMRWIIAFALIRWVSRIAEWTGFIIGYVLPTRALRWFTRQKRVHQKRTSRIVEKSDSKG